MIEKKLLVISSLLLTLLFVGCATTSGIKDEPLNAGDSQSFDAAYDDVLQATRTAVSDAGLGIQEAYAVNEETFVIIGKARSSAFSYGGYARAVVERIDDESTMVRVLSKRKLAINVTAKGDYSDSIFASIELLLR